MSTQISNSTTSTFGPFYNMNQGSTYSISASSLNIISGSWGSNSYGLTCTTDANFEGEVKIKGVSLSKTLEDIQQRLLILVPDPAKLEKYQALKLAYERYKTLEAMLYDESSTNS